MRSVFALHEPYTSHLHDVLHKMKWMGPPRIRAVWRSYYGRKGWYVIEGSHRIAAACRLALTPIIVPVRFEDRVKHDVSSINTDYVKDIIKHFDEGWREDRSSHWLEYCFPKLRGPRGGT